MKVLNKEGKAPKIKKYGPKEKVMVVPPQKPNNLIVKEGHETKLIEFSPSGTVSQVSVLTGPLISPRSQTKQPS
jgi:hypothetical protein